MKINRLEHTKKLYPHFYDKTDESNFTKHLKIVGNQQQDIRHKLKSVEWSRILEKPLQLWKEQTQPYIYDMHFKVIVPYLKQVNIYKNPIINDNEEVIGYEELSYTEDFEYEDRTILFEKVLDNLESTSMIPRTNYLLEIYTWDDYHFLKGYPENDYTVKEDNILTYRYNESFLSISIEEISYTKYLTFRVHKDKIKHIQIYKNDEPFFKQVFDYDLIKRGMTKGFSYTYFDDDVTNEPTYLQNDGSPYHYEIEDDNTNNIRKYFVGSKDEYVYRLLLTDSDFEEGVLKDIYDLEVRTFEKRYHCRQDYDKVYSKRYAGYDEQLNDCFDHDYSLDMIGRLLNIPRFRFYQVYEEDEAHYSRTYPTYYNRATEDDYNYMKRIQFYISNYNHIVFPVLEFWKYYHTMATIRSRKRILGEMDYAYFRTSQSDDYICSDEIEWLEEEFDSETITEYSINKATLTKGDSQYVSLGDGWYETTIVNNVYVVPDVDYRLRYGVKDNEENVTIRLICYNRQGIELRTTPVIPVSTNDLAVEYSTDAEYTYTDTLITIPSDTTSIKLVLESNNSFKFTDVTFERKTVIDFDNMYMTTEEDYNSNVYELYCVYEDLPTNLRIGGDRFNILFKRSLPLTKRGFFLVDIDEEKTNYVEATTNLELYVKNILMGNETSGVIGVNNDYNSILDYFIKGENNYNLSYFVKSLDDSTMYESNYDDVLFDSDDAFVDVFNDECTSSNNKSSGYFLGNGSYSFDNDGLVLESEYSATENIHKAHLRLDDSNMYTVPFEVSFDLVNDGNDNFRCYFHNTSFSNSAFTSGTLWTNPSGQTTKIRFVVTEEGITRYINDTPTKLNLNQDVASTVGVRLGYWQSTQSSIKIKNYKVTELDKTKFTTATAPVIMTPNDNALTLTYVNGNYIVNANKDGGTEFDYDGDFSVEFDIVGTPNNVTLQIYENNSTNFYSKSLNQIGALKPCHIKIVKIGTKIYTFVDGVENVGQRFNSDLTGNCRFAFRCSTSGSFTFKNLKIAPVGYVPVIDDDELVFTTVTYYDSENNEIESEEMEQKIYSNIESHINHHFTTPTDTSKIKITISSETSAELSDIQLSRMEELTDDEVY